MITPATLKMIGFGLVIAAVLAVMSWVGITVGGWRTEAAKVPGLKQDIANRDATITEIQRQITVTTEASNGYQAELERLRNVPASPIGPIRLCKPATASRVQVPASKPGPDEAPGGGGPVPSADGESPDIGPALFALADDADRCSAQVRGLQEFSRKLAGQQ